ncbi:hypothetical protein BTO05_02625 [Winogradskyella sp. PC-19]|uniref:DUF4062 domain-containing protein n=1 Tax=unclassified Winogradskyella TaxID=2615021 RepID=UPI000B3CA08E|nr:MULTISPECIES: DUF4062 domain-containing protein [unclassified Winogradskyella]ARV08587.1 hypothetical protein BTO05_02625 [Winogradskyella sp. PC-19]
MPKSLPHYRIFLASPSDLKDDRDSIDDVINELNLTFGSQHNIHLDLIKWETHSAPGITNNHVQKIINKDVGNEYDLFVGLLWKRFGTPTDEADSGTEEEFLNAYKRYQDNSSSLQILFYFNNSPFSLDDINLEELKKIKDFKSDISKNKNVLYWEYNDSEQLSYFLRTHIPKRILDLQKKHQEEDNKKRC